MSLRRLSLVLALVAFVLVAWSIPAAAASYTIKLGLSSAATKYGFQYRPYEVFKAVVERQSGGRIEVKIFPSNQLGRAGSLVKQVRKGIVQAMAPSAGILASHFPPIQVLYTPYVFKSEEVAWKVMDGWFGKELAEALRQKTGLRILAWNENGGFRNFVSARTVLTGPESLKGMKIRTEKVPASMEIARALGANPTPIAWKEVYTSMQTGVVDGMENSVNTFLKSKLEEVSKSMILDGHVYSCIAFMINDKFYQSLPADLQRVIDRAALIANYVNRGLSRNAESLGIQYMRKRGMVVTEPTPEQMKVFRQATKERVRSAIEKKIGKEWVDKLLKAIAEAEKELGLM